MSAPLLRKGLLRAQDAGVAVDRNVSIGIGYDVRGGEIVVKYSKVQIDKAGQPIRFPVEGKGRFEPTTVNGWFGEHTINVRALPPHNTADAPEALEKAEAGASTSGKEGASLPPATDKPILPSDGEKGLASTADGWFGSSAGPGMTHVGCCEIHGLIENHPHHSDATHGK